MKAHFDCLDKPTRVVYTEEDEFGDLQYIEDRDSDIDELEDVKKLAYDEGENKDPFLPRYWFKI